jgi:hypothetical protein
MTTGPGASLRASLCAAAEEELASGAFCTGEFSDAERLFGEALTLAREDAGRTGHASGRDHSGHGITAVEPPGELRRE